MDFFINQFSVLPKIKLKLFSDGVLDYQKFNSMLENAVATFSMINIDTGVYVIANVEAGIVVKTIENTNGVQYEYFIEYKWTEKNTSKPGSFIGQFKIDFFGDNTCESLVVPIKEKLYIYIQESLVKTTRIKL